LQFGLASVIQAIRRNPGKYNNLLVINASSSSTSTAAEDLPLSHIDAYRDMILEQANRLYDSLLHRFTNSIIDNAVDASSSSDSKLSSMFPNLPNQSDMDRMDNSESFLE
jgi:hypothetical protein